MESEEIRFDPDDGLDSAVYTALGAASMCWSERPSGVFDSTRAKEIGDALVFGPFRTQARASGEGLNIFGPLVFGNPVKWSVHRMVKR